MKKNISYYYSDVVSNVEVEGIAYDSRKVEKNNIFVAINGKRENALKYIESAIGSGAIFIVYDKKEDITEIKNKYQDVVFIGRDSPRAELSYLSNKFYDNPTEHMDILAVTGTNGKTTTTYLIKAILENNNYQSALIGTIQNMIADKTIPTSLTTPESLDTQAIFRETVDSGIKHAVMETSSHALALSRCDDINFSHAIFTNITEDHLDYHQTMEEYLNAKLKLFNLLSKSTSNKKNVFINIHTDHFERIKNYAKSLGLNIKTFGMSYLANYKAEIISLSIKKIEYKFYKDNKFISNVSLKLLGEFNVLNSLSALAYAFENDLDIEKSIRAIESIQVPGRFEIVTNDKHNFIVVVDYSHTPDSLINAMKAARALKPSRVLVVFGCGGDRDRLKRPMMAEATTKYSDMAYLTLDNPRTENIDAIMADIEYGYKNTNFKYKKIIDRREAIEAAINDARENDIVIIAGKGHEPYQIFADKTIHFDDREVAREILKNKFGF